MERKNTNCEANASVLVMETETSFPNYSEFSPSSFLENYYSKRGASYGHDRSCHALRCYHEAFKELPNGLRVLDYGAGPSILPTISASTKATEIILSDYADQNCKVLQQWLEGDPGAFDWSTYFKFVVQELEGKSEKEVKERQDLVRKLVKAVVHCDITQEPPIDPGYDKVYDVVVSSKVVESVARNLDEYVIYLSRLGGLVKPGGMLMMYTIENKTGIYNVGGINFRNLPVPVEFTVSTLKKAG